MIGFERHQLANGLKVICHTDLTTPLVCVNVLYDVGSRDEDPNRTGFAHLFEHLMFGGSAHIPAYDHHVEAAGGENNAFTSSDITNYYLTMPAGALETAFWLESDRMFALDMQPQGLKTQKSVVVEEFRQRYLNQPYGDAWLLLRPLAYSRHPYRWPAIGMHPSHIEAASLGEVEAFYRRFYHPANAVLSVAGNVKPDKVFTLAEYWFGDIPSPPKVKRNLPAEPPQTEARWLEVQREVPAEALFRVFKMGGRMEESFFAADLLSDILSSGESSRLYRRLVKERSLFNDISTHLSGDLDPGLWALQGRVAEEVSWEEALQALDEEVQRLTEKCVTDRELQKVRHKLESTLSFSALSLAERALNLAYYENTGDAGRYNTLLERYLEVKPTDLLHSAQQIFRAENASSLIITPKN
jgi:predicted Zn-dependent peptidase